MKNLFVNIKYLIITTQIDPAKNAIDYAESISNQFDIRMVDRRNETLARLMRRNSCENIIVVGNDGIKVMNMHNDILFFHPSMAKVRITTIKKGLFDRMVEISGVTVGSCVLDCTAGMGTDSIVFSYCSGDKGKVIAVESEIIPYIILQDGINNYSTKDIKLNEAIKRIKPVFSNHLKYLKSLKNSSFDIVYFDPMFERPLKAVSLNTLREYTNKEQLTHEAINEAKRVARRRIVLKNRFDSKEFEKFGFKVVIDKNRSGVSYGVIECL